MTKGKLHGKTLQIMKNPSEYLKTSVESGEVDFWKAEMVAKGLGSQFPLHLEPSAIGSSPLPPVLCASSVELLPQDVALCT